MLKSVIMDPNICTPAWINKNKQTSPLKWWNVSTGLLFRMNMFWCPLLVRILYSCRIICHTELYLKMRLSLRLSIGCFANYRVSSWYILLSCFLIYNLSILHNAFVESQIQIVFVSLTCVFLFSMETLCMIILRLIRLANFYKLSSSWYFK